MGVWRLFLQFWGRWRHTHWVSGNKSGSVRAQKWLPIYLPIHLRSKHFLLWAYLLNLRQKSGLDTAKIGYCDTVRKFHKSDMSQFPDIVQFLSRNSFVLLLKHKQRGQMRLSCNGYAADFCLCWLVSTTKNRHNLASSGLSDNVTVSNSHCIDYPGDCQTKQYPLYRAKSSQMDAKLRTSLSTII